MHIALLNDDFPLEGGTSVAHLTKILAEELRASGHTVTVVCTHRKEDDANVLTGEAGTIVSLPVSYRASLRHYFSLYNPIVSKELDAVLQRLQPDVVHAHNIHMYLTFDALRIAKKYTNKVFLTCHDAMTVAYGRVHEAKKLSTIDHLQTAGLQYNPLRNWWIRKLITKNVRQVTAVSTALGKVLELNGIPNVRTIHNGADAHYWKAKADEVKQFQKTYEVKEKKVILFSGRLRREKGVVQLVKALPKILESVPNALLMIVGEEDCWNGLFAEAKLPQLAKHCVCTGWLSHQQLAAAYASCAVVTTSSLYIDPFVLVNLEAMINKKPVVGTCFGGTPEIVEHEKTGLICNPRNASELADAIIDVLQDEKKAEAMGQAGAARATTHFTRETMTNKYLNLYQQ